MFEHLFEQIYYKRRVKLTEESVVYFHYGVVNAIQLALHRVAEKPAPVSPEAMKDVTIGEYRALSEARFIVDEEIQQPWLDPLITSIVNIKHLKLGPEAQEYLNKLILATSHAILHEAANIAAQKRPETMLILLEDLEAACLDIFPSKPWFLC